EADIFADGHDILSALLLYRKEGASSWSETPMQPLVNDRWVGTFDVTEIGNYYYTLQAWVDRFKSLRQGLLKKVEAAQDVALDLMVGSKLIELAAKSASDQDRDLLARFATLLRGEKSTAIRHGQDDALAGLMEKYSERRGIVACDRELQVNVERSKARF